MFRNKIVYKQKIIVDNNIIDDFYSKQSCYEDAMNHLYLKNYISKKWTKLSFSNINDVLINYLMNSEGLPLKLDIINNMNENWEIFKEYYDYFMKHYDLSKKYNIMLTEYSDTYGEIILEFSDYDDDVLLVLNFNFLETLYDGILSKKFDYLKLEKLEFINKDIFLDLFTEYQTLMEPYLNENYKKHLEEVNEPFLEELNQILKNVDDNEYFIRYKPNTNNIIQISCDDINYFKEFEVLEDSDAFMLFFCDCYFDECKYEIKTKQELLQFINTFKLSEYRDKEFENYFVNLYNNDFNSIKFEITKMNPQDDNYFGF